MFTPVEPVPAGPPSTGLVASAITPNDGERWQTGMAWRSERCPQARGFDPCGGEEGFGPEMGVGGDDLVYYRPPAFRVFSDCGTRGGQRVGSDEAARVRRQALAVTSFMVATELETGALTRSQPYDIPDGGTGENAYLASAAATVITGEWEPLAGLGQLEQEARQSGLGMDVWIHMPVRLVSLLGDHLIQEGNLIRTRTGARVVADAGYEGVGPLDAGTSEVQTVTINGGPTGGTFTLTASGDETAPIAYNAAAATVQAALNALPSVDSVTVTGAAGGPYTVTFPASAGNVAQMTADSSGLTGGTAPTVVVATTTPGVAPTNTAGLWMYATGPVQVRLSDVAVAPLLVWRENRWEAVADRLFAATFDPCTLHGIQVADPAPAP